MFMDSEGFRERYLTWFWSGLLVGIFMQVVGGAVQTVAPNSVPLVMIGVFSLLAGGLIHAVAYASGVAWLCLRPRGRQVLRPVAAVGRMALTNYLMSSIVFGLIFYGYGLGLIGRLTTVQALLIALGLYAAQLVLSPLWLARFRFGPFEWLWRTITYWRRQPLSRRPAVPSRLQ